MKRKNNRFRRTRINLFTLMNAIDKRWISKLKLIKRWISKLKLIENILK
jgi:hypothetical protein